MADIDAMVATNSHANANEAADDIIEANVDVQETENKFQQAIAAWRSEHRLPYLRVKHH